MFGYMPVNAGVHSPQRGVGPLELELQAVVTCPTSGLGNRT